MLFVRGDELKFEDTEHGVMDDGDDDSGEPKEDSSRGKTSVFQTVLNLMKTCMGSGKSCLF